MRGEGDDPRRVRVELEGGARAPERAGCGGNSAITLEQVPVVTSTFATKVWNNNWRAWAELTRRTAYRQHRNAAPYAIHRKTSELLSG